MSAIERHAPVAGHGRTEPVAAPMHCNRGEWLFLGGAEEPYQADSRRSLIALLAAFKDWSNDGDDGVAGADVGAQILDERLSHTKVFRVDCKPPYSPRSFSSSRTCSVASS
jgi:hypothetical protein